MLGLLEEACLLALVGTRLLGDEDIGEEISDVIGTLVAGNVSLRRRPIDNLRRKVSLAGVGRPSEFEEVLSCNKELVKDKILQTTEIPRGTHYKPPRVWGNDTCELMVSNELLVAGCEIDESSLC